MENISAPGTSAIRTVTAVMDSSAGTSAADAAGGVGILCRRLYLRDSHILICLFIHLFDNIKVLILLFSAILISTGGGIL